MPDKDLVSGKDRPLLSRFAGAKMVSYEVKQFDGVQLPAGKRAKDKFEKGLTPAALAEIAKLMQRNSQLKVYIVGHTDNKGRWPTSAACRRSAPRPWPVASNDSDAGREKNRRVELVKQ